MIGTAEKGYVDVQITVNTPGGHSSIPPDLTSIDYLAKIITLVSDHQFPTKLTNRNPTTKYLSVAAKHGKTMPEELRHAILDPERMAEVLEYLSSSAEMKALVRTSSAVDVIQGGEKGMHSRLVL